MPQEKRILNPSWLQENLDAQFQQAEALGIVDEIERLCAERKTAKQIAQELRPRFGQVPDFANLIRSVRVKRKIPSVEDTAEFEAWLKKYQLR